MSLTEASLAAPAHHLLKSADKRLTFKFVQSDDEEENDNGDGESDNHGVGQSGSDSVRDEGLSSLQQQSLAPSLAVPGFD